MSPREAQPISHVAAARRIAAAGLDLVTAMHMTDSELLRHPTIGRRTLRYIRVAAYCAELDSDSDSHATEATQRFTEAAGLTTHLKGLS